MFRFIRLFLGTLVCFFRVRQSLLLENLALRQQLAVLRRRRRSPCLSPFDKLFWVAVSRFWSGWKQALIVVTPETVIRWHRVGPELAEIIARRKKARRLVTVDGVTALAEPIFHRGDGLPIGEFKKSWATAAKKARCPGRLFHDFLRTCARRLLAAGVPQVVARELTGHRTSAMFDRYAIVSSTDVLAAQRKVAQFR
jgi:integrase